MEDVEFVNVVVVGAICQRQGDPSLPGPSCEDGKPQLAGFWRRDRICLSPVRHALAAHLVAWSSRIRSMGSMLAMNPSSWWELL